MAKLVIFAIMATTVMTNGNFSTRDKSTLLREILVGMVIYVIPGRLKYIIAM